MLQNSHGQHIHAPTCAVESLFFACLLSARLLFFQTSWASLGRQIQDTYRHYKLEPPMAPGIWGFVRRNVAPGIVWSFLRAGCSTGSLRLRSGSYCVGLFGSYAGSGRCAAVHGHIRTLVASCARTHTDTRGKVGNAQMCSLACLLDLDRGQPLHGPFDT